MHFAEKVDVQVTESAENLEKIGSNYLVHQLNSIWAKTQFYTKLKKNLSNIIPLTVKISARGHVSPCVIHAYRINLKFQHGF